MTAQDSSGTSSTSHSRVSPLRQEPVLSRIVNEFDVNAKFRTDDVNITMSIGRFARRSSGAAPQFGRIQKDPGADTGYF